MFLHIRGSVTAHVLICQGPGRSFRNVGFTIFGRGEEGYWPAVGIPAGILNVIGYFDLLSKNDLLWFYLLTIGILRRKWSLKVAIDAIPHGRWLFRFRLEFRRVAEAVFIRHLYFM